MLYEVITVETDTVIDACLAHRPNVRSVIDLMRSQRVLRTVTGKAISLTARDAYRHERTRRPVITSYSIHYTKLYEAAQTAAQRPVRGMSMASVEARYGAPTTREGAVGDPPISRWDYPAFVVYFEYDHVIHAVVRH